MPKRLAILLLSGFHDWIHVKKAMIYIFKVQILLKIANILKYKSNIYWYIDVTLF